MGFERILMFTCFVGPQLYLDSTAEVVTCNQLPGLLIRSVG